MGAILSYGEHEQQDEVSDLKQRVTISVSLGIGDKATVQSRQ